MLRVRTIYITGNTATKQRMKEACIEFCFIDRIRILYQDFTQIAFPGVLRIDLCLIEGQ